MNVKFALLCQDSPNGGVYWPRSERESGWDRHESSGGVRYWERQFGRSTEAEDNAVLSQKRETGRFTEENVGSFFDFYWSLKEFKEVNSLFFCFKSKLEFAESVENCDFEGTRRFDSGKFKSLRNN